MFQGFREMQPDTIKGRAQKMVENKKEHSVCFFCTLSLSFGNGGVSIVVLCENGNVVCRYNTFDQAKRFGVQCLCSLPRTKSVNALLSASLSDVIPGII